MTHPRISDEKRANAARGPNFSGLLAPSGARHGALIPKEAKDPLFVGGFGAPPQLDLLINRGSADSAKGRGWAIAGP
jgi:hypothetical protein